MADATRTTTAPDQVTEPAPPTGEPKASAPSAAGGSGLTRRIVIKVLTSLLVLWAVVTIVFFLARISGDPVALLLPPEATPEQAAVLRAQLGLDRPLGVQYLEYLRGLLSFDFGTSIHYGEPVRALIAERIPATALLAVAAFALTLLIAIPAGCIAALRRGKAADSVIMGIVLIGQSTPAFWLGIVLILLFSVQLRILPAAGYGTPANLVLPAVTLAIYSVAVVARLLRSSLVEVLGTDYVRTARAKGAAESSVVLSHSLRNASLPVVTVLGLEFGSLLGGAIMTEQIFAWPGLGRLTIEAIANRDFPLVQGTVVLFAVTFVVVNLLVDLSYAIIDPRVRVEA